MADLTTPDAIKEMPGLVDWLLSEVAIREAFISAMEGRGFSVTKHSAPKPPAVEPPQTNDFGPATAIVAAMKRLGHEIYFAKAGKARNLNIVYVRNTSPKVDVYGCRLVVFWQELSGEWTLKSWTVTTYPGSRYLIQKLLNPKGCAILKEGQYKGVYAVSNHRGVYPALCQRLGKVSVYRDGDRDREFDLEPSSVITGDYGINCHAPVVPSSSNADYVAKSVGSSSAGCLVFQRMADFREFMLIVGKSRELWGNTFTVTLIRDSDLEATVNPVTPTTQPSSPPTTPISQDGIDLIQHFESCLKPVGNGMFEAYADPAHGWKVPTIGWGTIHYPNGQSVKQGDRITQSQADEYFAWEIGEKTLQVLQLVKVEINDDQLAALVSFAYNLGAGALAESTLLAKLNAGDFAGAAEEFPRWNKAGGRTLIGLTRRRLSEKKLFLSKRPFIVTLDELRS